MKRFRKLDTICHYLNNFLILKDEVLAKMSYSWRGLAMLFTGLFAVLFGFSDQANAKEPDSDGFYREVIDLSEYGKNAVLVQVKGGVIKSIVNVSGGNRYKATGTFVSNSQFFIDTNATGFYPRADNKYELTIEAKDSNYKVESNGEGSKNKPFDLTNISIKNGHYVDFSAKTEFKKDEYFAFHLEKGKKYLYEIDGFDPVSIISPSGDVIKTYGIYSGGLSSNRWNLDFANILTANETGTYMIHKGIGDYDSSSFNVKLYEFVDKISDIDHISFNPTDENTPRDERYYAVGNKQVSSYSLSALYESNNAYQHQLFLNVYDYYDFNRNASDQYNRKVVDAFTSSLELDKSSTFEPNKGSVFNPVYNSRDNLYLNLMNWRIKTHDSKIDVKLKAKPFTPKTGDAAKEKVKELNAEYRDTSLIADPIDTYAGNFTDRRTLMSYNGNNPLSFELQYDSLAGGEKSLSQGFTHNFETYITKRDTGLDLHWSANSVVRFKKDGSSYKSEQDNQKGISLKETDAGYRVIDQTGQVYEFDQSGKIVLFRDKAGLVTAYQYTGELLTAVSNKKGQTFTFKYDGKRLISVKDIANREISFSYSSDRLSNVITPNKESLTIGHVRVETDTYKVSSLTYAGKKIVHNYYDKFGRIKQQSDGNGRSTSFSYDEYSDDDRITTKVSAGSRSDEFVHDKNGNLVSKTDGEGHIETYKYDTSRNLISKTDKSGNVYKYEYDSKNRLTKEMKPSGLLRVYEYDDQGNVTKLTTEDGQSVKNTYDDGRLVSITNKNGVKTTYDYDAFGNVTSMSKSGITTTSEYDKNGYVSSIKKNGQTTKFENDSLGRPLTITYPNGDVKTNTYDADHNVISTTDPSGNKIAYDYNVFGNKVKQTDEKGVVTTYDYDGNGHLTKEKTGDRETIYSYNQFDQLTEKYNRNGNNTKNKESYSYNKRGDMISYKDADSKGYTLTYDANGNILTKKIGSSSETYTYDQDGNTISETDGNGNKIVYEYDDMGRIVKETSGRNSVRLYTYDAMGQLLSMTDGEGHKTTYLYDDQGNLIKEIDPNGSETAYEYNENDQLTIVTNALGEKETRRYNNMGQLSDVLNDSGDVVFSYDYDHQGRLIKQTDGNNHANEFVYDSVGNLLEVKDGFGQTIESNEYNQYRELISSVDSLNHKELINRDGFGNIDKLIDAAGNTTTNTYTSASRLSAVKDVLGTTADYRFDDFGHISSIGEPNSFSRNITYTRDANQNVIRDSFNLGTISYGYDADNNLTKKTNARNSQITYQYDQNNQLIKETSPDDAAVFTYDKAGNQLTAKSSSDDIKRTYDALGRVISKTQNGQKIGYAYDHQGRVSKITYPNGKSVDYVYDIVGNLLKVTDWNNNETFYKYDKNNRLIETKNWNGTIESRTYNKQGQMTRLTTLNNNGSKIADDSFSYDASGNIIKENDREMTYDALNRLITAGQNQYQYSGFGNITEFSVLKNDESVMQKMTYGSDNQLRSINGSDVTVDKDGNLTKYKLDGKDHVATYDVYNRLTSFDGTTYTYDIENNRTSVTEGGKTTTFVTDNDSDDLSKVLVETTGDQSVYHVYGNGLIGSYNHDGDFETHHYDYRVSTIGITDEDGSLIGKVSYDEYGSITSKDASVKSKFLFNGKYGVQTDKNGLYYMRARYYNSDLKRFVNRDIIQGDITESQTLNRYSFVNGNPVSYYDPFGLARELLNDVKSSLMNSLHEGLDYAGLIPGVGAAFDAVNAGIYLSEGNYDGALLSGIGMIPIVGDAAVVAKRGGKILDHGLVRDYVRDIESRTGLKIHDSQKVHLKNAIRNNKFEKLSPIETKKHRSQFTKNKKDALIQEWEQNTGQKWARYTEPYYDKNGIKRRSVGDPYDAHHIIENNVSGPHEWWNMHPARFPDQHQKGIHGSGSPSRKLFK